MVTLLPEVHSLILLLDGPQGRRCGGGGLPRGPDGGGGQHVPLHVGAAGGGGAAAEAGLDVTGHGRDDER